MNKKYKKVSATLENRNFLRLKMGVWAVEYFIRHVYPACFYVTFTQCFLKKIRSRKNAILFLFLIHVGRERLWC